MDIDSFYTRVGGSHANVLTRLMNDRIVTKFINKYPGDDSFATIKQGIEAKDWETAFRGAHTLKGVSANLDFGDLNKAAVALTEALRGGKALTDYSLYEAVVEAQETVLKAIAEFNA